MDALFGMSGEGTHRIVACAQFVACVLRTIGQLLQQREVLPNLCKAKNKPSFGDDRDRSQNDERLVITIESCTGKLACMRTQAKQHKSLTANSPRHLYQVYDVNFRDV
jgi:hypothetical protein